MDLKRMILLTFAASLLAACGKSRDTTLILPLLVSAGAESASPADAGMNQTPAAAATVETLTSPAAEDAEPETLEAGPEASGAADGAPVTDETDPIAGDVTEKCERTVTIDSARGKWFETTRIQDGRSTVSGIHTYWQDQPLLVHVRGNCKAGWYKIRVAAKNTAGPLPSWYSHFVLRVTDLEHSHEYNNLQIKASDEAYKAGSRLVFLTEGDSNFELTWINDAYKQGVYDANIQIKSIRVIPARNKSHDHKD